MSASFGMEGVVGSTRRVLSLVLKPIGLICAVCVRSRGQHPKHTDRPLFDRPTDSTHHGRAFAGVWWR